MTIDEAIKHAEEVVEENRNVDEEELGLIYCDDTECIENHKKRCFKCADEHEQLAEWLTDYKRLLEQKPREEVSEKLQKIEQIIKEHDEDRMPEDYFYIDKIREVLEDDSN